MARMTAVTDAVNFNEWDDRQKKHILRTMRKGQTADVPDEEVARIEQLRQDELDANDRRRSGGLGDGHPVDHRAGHIRWVPEDEYEEYTSTVQAETDPLARFSDDEIRGWDADQTIAQMNQIPGMAERVLELEQERKPRRRAVVAHAQRLLDAREGKDVSQAPAEETETGPLLPASEA